jgi:ribosomal protein S12 methylthiotransferase
MRERIPDVALRTAFIVGFPGETDADFAELLAFTEETCFDRVGVFRYSKEEGTAAAGLSGHLPERVKRHRYNLLMRAQAEVSSAINRRLIGSVEEVLVCGEDDRGRGYGRLASQAPDIDGVVYLRGQAPPGHILSVQITGAGTYDLEGEFLSSKTLKAEDEIGVDRAGEYL